MNTKFEFDRKFETTASGEKIIPSSFNVLKDKIRVRDESFRKKEEDFLKALESIGTNDDELDLEQPLAFKAKIEEDKIKIEKLEFTDENIKDKLVRRMEISDADFNFGERQDSKFIDMRTESTADPDLQSSEISVNKETEQQKQPPKKPEVKINNLFEELGLAPQRKEFLKLFDENPNIDDAVTKFESLKAKVFKDSYVTDSAKESSGEIEVIDLNKEAEAAKEREAQIRKREEEELRKEIRLNTLANIERERKEKKREILF